MTENLIESVLKIIPGELHRPPKQGSRFEQDEPVMIRRFYGPGEYRAKVVGRWGMRLRLTDPDLYIVELIDPIPACEWSHTLIDGKYLDSIAVPAGS